MRAFRPATGRALRGVAAAWALSLAAASALASPDSPDPLLRLPVDASGLAEPPAAPAVAANMAPKAGLLRRMHDRASDLTVAALDLIGVRYQRGGMSAETGFDCSGFTRHVFEMSLGLILPRRVDEQAIAPGLVAVGRDDLRPGDLVFFNTLKRTFSHVGIYIGNNRFVHSPRPGRSVRTEDMSFAYWATRFTGARRVETVTAVDPSIAVPPSVTATATDAE